MTRSRVMGLIALIVVLLVCTVLGSVLLNAQWPGEPAAWLRVGVGGVLAIVALLCGELLFRVVYDSQARGRHGAPTKSLDVLERLSNALVKPKRIVVILLLGLAWYLVAVLAPPLLTVATPAPELETGDLVMVSAIDESPSDPRWVLIQQWNQAHPENRVRVETVSGEPDQQHRDIAAAAASDEQVDVYLLDVVWMTEFIERDHIRPLDETNLDTDDFIGNVLSTCKDNYGHRDGLWALPLNTDAGLLYYRDDVPGLTPPIKWEDSYGAEAKEAFATARGTAGLKNTLKGANAAELDDEEVLTVSALEAMWAAGGEVVDTGGGLVYDQDRVEFDPNALTGLENLATAYRAAGTILPDSITMDENTALNAFKGGQALYMRNWPVAYDTLESAGDKRDVSFGVTRLPGPSVLGGQNLAIAGGTDKPRAAQAFIEFLTTAASQLILFEAGGFAPARDSAYDNSTRPYKDMLRGAVVGARPRPYLPNYTEFSAELRKGVLRAIKNDGELAEDFPRELAKKAR